MLASRFALLLVLLPALVSAEGLLRPVHLDRIQLPDGFEIEVFARVENARAITWGEQGTLFVGSREAGHVHAVPVVEGVAGTPVRIATGLTMPAGVAFRKGDLYVSSLWQILRYAGIEDRLDAVPEPIVVSDVFPRDNHHGWKFIAFGPDDKLYVPVGAPCNICEPDPDRYANIMRMNPDGTGLEVFAYGVRNTVGFTWHPQTGEMWFTDNGRDRMGDDIPDCELNRAPRAGMHFGYPYCHGRDVSDPEFGDKRSCSEFEPPVLELGPHVAPLGLRFYTASQFPAEYKNNLFIAERGSWDRSEKIGYRVKRVILQADGTARQEVFAEGWLQGQQSWGRVADVLQAPDGSLLVSDDYAGAIYRISYRGPAHRQAATK